MNPIVKLTKQGVRDLDSGRKRIRTVAPAEPPAEVAGTDVPPEQSLEESPAVDTDDGAEANRAAAASAR
jgi:hypothetical protein